MDQYTEAHLIVAAIRLLRHKSGQVPSVEDLCGMLDISVESGLATFRRLETQGVLTIMEDPFSARVSISDHLKIEELPKEEQSENTLAKELEEFQSKKRDMDAKVEAIQAELAQKRQSMFSDIEKKFQEEMQKKK
ncbi:MAG: hypothetical protein D6B25_09560 [Desulfobulbaceae bacterium]|nr:MAG: hypothetical protein D6B25_09560 [Desulfobulbaceae bacterium]